MSAANQDGVESTRDRQRIVAPPAPHRRLLHEARLATGPGFPRRSKTFPDPRERCSTTRAEKAHDLAW